MWQQPDTRKLVLWGGTCMALPPQGSHTQSGGCLVGSEGGAVFTCNLDGSRPALQAFTQVLAMCSMKQTRNLPTGAFADQRQSAATQDCLDFSRHAGSITMNYLIDLPSFAGGMPIRNVIDGLNFQLEAPANRNMYVSAC